LETDNRVVLPVDTTIRLIVTAADVLHSWAMPAFGIKIDAVPGRLNETWFRIDRAGVYFGQCSELCGINHGFMPIAIEAVSKAKFNTWVRRARQKSARAGAPEAGTLARLDRSVRPVNGEVGGRE
jgi:cytochrome c oxidase subunit 2